MLHIRLFALLIIGLGLGIQSVTCADVNAPPKPDGRNIFETLPTDLNKEIQSKDMSATDRENFRKAMGAGSELRTKLGRKGMELYPVAIISCPTLKEAKEAGLQWIDENKGKKREELSVNNLWVDSMKREWNFTPYSSLDATDMLNATDMNVLKLVFVEIYNHPRIPKSFVKEGARPTLQGPTTLKCTYAIQSWKNNIAFILTRDIPDRPNLPNIVAPICFPNEINLQSRIESTYFSGLIVHFRGLPRDFLKLPRHVLPDASKYGTYLFSNRLPAYLREIPDGMKIGCMQELR
ncbi:MAG: hypothetical protein K2Y18_02950 [Alphaproteobacteria bacterium]|nr:hypothetical protein [Alphaproteobacteria bacterium]